MTAIPTPHLEKLKAALENEKLPASDVPRVKAALVSYHRWIDSLMAVSEKDVPSVVEKMVGLLNEYRNYLDIDLVFDSDADFLYRQKGQTKLDNSVIEEFLPILVYKCVVAPMGDSGIELGPKQAFSAVYFTSSLDHWGAGGGLHVRTKDQDFTVARRLFLRTSYDPAFRECETKECYLAYVAAECKTNLDKTMFQEAVATAHDVKGAVVGAKYFLICEWLDMTPQSTAATDIDEVLILRKAKRLGSDIRRSFGSLAGRKRDRHLFVNYLKAHPFAVDVFERFVTHITALMSAADPVENDVLGKGYF